MSKKAIIVEVECIKGEGKCPLGLEIGDSWLIDSAQVPSGFRGWAYNSIFPFIQVLRFGGSFPWESPGEARVSCSDSVNSVFF